MSGRYLLDTNIVIALFGEDSKVQARIGEAPEVFLSATVLGELLYGAANSAQAEGNTIKTEGFAATCEVLAVDEGTARSYGKLRANLKREGRPIPENDLWIAACALQHDLILVTRDRHFDLVNGLRNEAW